MDYLTGVALLMIVGVFTGVVAFVVSVIVRGKKKLELGLSRDEAEAFALERIPTGIVVGTRFVKNENSSVWEFDVLDKEVIYRVQVGAISRKILNEQELPAKQKYGASIGTKIPE